VARNYNPLSAESGSSITLLVKRYPDAKMGTALHSLKIGGTVEVKGPNKQWSLEKGKYQHVAMVAGGTGITPLIQASEFILANDGAKVTMVTFNKTSDDVLLQDTLTKLEVMYAGRFTVVHAVESGATMNQVEGTPTSAELMKALLPPPADGTLVMICGRPPMTAAVAGPKTPDFKQGDIGGVLKDLGYSSEQVWKV
jgi:cytochrome-b5 reductase